MDDTGILLNQIKYVLDILSNIVMTNYKLADCSFPQGLKLSKHDGDLIMTRPEVYRRIIGKFVYLSMTRRDLSFVVQ